MTETTSPDATLQTTWPTEPAGTPPPKRSRLWFIHELPVLLVIALAMAFLLKTLLLQAFYIPSESMQPTLFGGRLGHDRVLVNKLAYRFREPRRGEVVVFVAHPDTTQRSFVDKTIHLLFDGLGVITPKETIFIKRIIAEPGDTITVTATGVLIKPPGKKAKRFKLREPYINSTEDGKECGGTGSKCPQGPSFGPFKVPKDRYFMLGDNRANSSDSRFSLGPVARDRILGKAFVRIWPPKRWSVIASATYPVPKTPAKKPVPTPKASANKKPAALPLPFDPVAPLMLLAAGFAIRRGARR